MFVMLFELKTKRLGILNITEFNNTSNEPINQKLILNTRNGTGNKYFKIKKNYKKKDHHTPLSVLSFSVVHQAVTESCYAEKNLLSFVTNVF